MNRRRFWILGMAALALVPAGLMGCGGSSGSSGNTTPANSRAVDVYITDGFDDRFKQVWVTLFSMEVSADGGATWTPIYNAPTAEGLTLNLLSLKDKAQLITSAVVPEGDYNALRVTFDDTVTVTEPGDEESREIQVESRGNVVVDGGKAIVTLTSDRPILARGGRSLVCDFDVASFELVGGKLRPLLKPFAPPGFESRERQAELVGIVRNLNNTGFILELPGPRLTRASIVLTDETLVSAPNGSDATLANGQRVLVRGAWNSNTHLLAAETIRILPNSSVENPHRAFAGTITRINSDQETFVLDLREAGMRPGSGSVRVVTTDSTQFRKVGRKSEQDASFEDLETDTRVVVFGTMDGERRTVTAARVQILPTHSR